jgi:hypothetical protein
MMRVLMNECRLIATAPKEGATVRLQSANGQSTIRWFAGHRRTCGSHGSFMGATARSNSHR